MVSAVAEHVIAKTIGDCGHFIQEEQPAEVVRLFLRFAAETV